MAVLNKRYRLGGRIPQVVPNEAGELSKCISSNIAVTLSNKINVYGSIFSINSIILSQISTKVAPVNLHLKGFYKKNLKFILSVYDSIQNGITELPHLKNLS